MPNKISWTEPSRPEIPNGWPIIIDGQNGTAYESVSEYLDALALIEANQTPNTPPNE